MYIDIAGKATYQIGDYYILEMPTTSPDIFLVDSVTNCDPAIFDFCMVFYDINWVILKFSALTNSATLQLTVKSNKQQYFIFK